MTVHRKNPYQAIQEAHAAGWNVELIETETQGDWPCYEVTHPDYPPGREDRPRIFDSVYLDEPAGWRAITRRLRLLSKESDDA